MGTQRSRVEPRTESQAGSRTESQAGSPGDADAATGSATEAEARVEARAEELTDPPVPPRPDRSAADEVLVTGASGVLGLAVVAELARRGLRPRAMARRHVELPRGVRTVAGDLVTGEYLERALGGVHTIVHCATDPVRHRAVDEEGTARLLETAARVAPEGRPPHVVHVSTVGVDAIPYAYYKSKLETERLVEESGLPWTIVRVTQFHDFVLALAQQFARPPLVVLPKLRVQPVDVRDVAERLAELVQAGPSGRVPDFGGPAVYRGEAVLRRYLAHVGVRRQVVTSVLPGAVWKAFRNGANLVEGPPGGHRSFGAYLDEQSVVDEGRVLVRSSYADRWSEASS